MPEALYAKRPDLINCGRTLIGALPPKNQQAELNYFAPVPPSVAALMPAEGEVGVGRVSGPGMGGRAAAVAAWSPH